MSDNKTPGNQFDGKETYVKDVFEEIAPYYDKMNDIMSMGMVQGWHKFMMKKAGDISGFNCLDVGAGTGEITFHVAKHLDKTGSVVGVDITPGMVELAKKKLESMNFESKVSFELGDALDLQYPEGTFDLVTSGYMLRNVTDIQGAVNEMYRVLKPGSKAIVAELAKPDNKIALWGYNIYMSTIIPHFGRKYDKGEAIDGRQPAYDWLTSSLEGFPHGDAMAEIFRNAGFSNVRYFVKSMGAVNIYVATK